MEDVDPGAVTRGQAAIVPAPRINIFASDGDAPSDIRPTPITAPWAEGQDEAEIRFFP